VNTVTAKQMTLYGHEWQFNSAFLLACLLCSRYVKQLRDIG